MKDNSSFTVTILGTNASFPGKDTITSAQLINIRDQYYMVDCGEGSQMKLQKYHIKRNKINAIFISHLHGDHIFGLPGLLTSYSHFHRKKPIRIFGPKGLKEFVECFLRISEAYLDFTIEIIELNHEGSEKIFEDEQVEVFSFPLNHRIKTYGFKFVEIKRFFNIKVEKIKELHLNFMQIKAIKQGSDLVMPDGQVILNGDLVLPKLKGRSYAYCSDTMYYENIIPFISEVDALFHESTYLNDLSVQAAERMHSTVGDAARIAHLANVGMLILGHYSSRYITLEEFIKQGREVFICTELAKEGVIFDIGNKKSI